MRNKSKANNHSEELEWRVYTSGLLAEIMVNPECAILKVPLQIFGALLNQVSERASQLNDPILNGLMCQLGLYEIADPNSSNHDQATVELLIKAKTQLQRQQ